jgi:Transposase and inactivated derivatives
MKLKKQRITPSSSKEQKQRRQSYPSDVTDRQWEQISAKFSGMRKCTWPKRELLDALLYLVKTGCQWRNLPHDFPPYSTVYSFFSRAKKNGLWDEILRHLVAKTRVDAGREPAPTYALVDSQSVKTVAASEQRGIDGGKKQKAGNVT